MDHAASTPSPFTLPDTLPVIVLEECCLFPGCFLPLYIFEQRYRQMLAHALSGSRMFCVGTMLTQGDEGDILPVSTAGLVRACKTQADGTSHVMLYGVGRIRLTGWTQEWPFRIATIEAMPTTLLTAAPDELKQMRDRALALLPDVVPECGEAMRELRIMLELMACPEVVCDILSYHFIRHPLVLHSLLAEPVLERRYRLLTDELERLREQA